MPQRGAPEFRPSDDDAGGIALPPALAAFDPVGEIIAIDRRRAATGMALDPVGEIMATDSRAATRAAAAEAFAARFGLDDTGPSAEAIADRYDFRYEPSEADSALPAGRRTVTITGRGADRSIPLATRSLDRGGPGRRAAMRATAVPRVGVDRPAMWAVLLALTLAAIAAVSAHGTLPF